jgi:hypothetical protein
MHGRRESARCGSGESEGRDGKWGADGRAVACALGSQKGPKRAQMRAFFVPYFVPRAFLMGRQWPKI